MKDTTISTLATEVMFHKGGFIFNFASCFVCATPLIYPLQTKVSSKLAALKGLDARLREIRGYLDLVIEAKLPLNHEILYHLQVHISLKISYVLCYSLIVSYCI